MHLLVCLLAAAAGLLLAAVEGQGFASGNIEAVAIGSLCSANGLVQLGAFSPYFVECNNRTAIVRMCPGRGEIFTRHRCQPAGTETQDDSVTFLNEETTRMAEQEQFCGAGALSGIYTVRTFCSRQALLCQGATPIAISCPKGYALLADLSCQPAGQQCYGQASSPLRDHFLQRLCFPPNSFVKQILSNQQEKCSIWYVNCKPRPSVVRCPPGSVFDPSQHQCRQWRQGDNCLMSGSCYGREYRSISIGTCQQSYFYCDGLQGKYLFCPEGMVFNGQTCASPETANCPACKNGNFRPAASCSQFFFCKDDQWTTGNCQPGTAYNQDHFQCEASFTCASLSSSCQPGSVVSVSCGKALLCNGHGFDEIICPPNTMFDGQQRKCVYQQSCNTNRCKEGDVILTPGCKSYRLCKNGQYSLFQCQNSHGQIAIYCQSCSSPNSPNGQQIPNFPAQCQEGAFQADQSQCTLYFECSGGQWNPRMCQNGEVWSSQWNKCVPPQYGQGCSVAVEQQCQEGERLYSPTETDCRRLLECRAARWVEMACPDGYRYDTTKKGCVPGQCSPQSPGPVFIPPRVPPQPPAPPPPAGNPDYGIRCSEGEQAADPYDCNKYTICRQGQLFTEFCPTGSGYHPTNRRCQEGHRCGAECQEGVVIPVATCGHYKVCVQGKYIDGRCNLNKVFANGQCSDQNCQQDIYYFPDCQDGQTRPPSQMSAPNPAVYMVCSNGRWEERNCGPQAVFNYQRMICEGQTGPLPPPGCYGGETKQIQESCQDYEVCHYGSWKRQRCPFGQKFINGFCVPGDCQERCVEAADAYRRDSYDCSKYYQCVHGNWMQRPCAPGTVFNERVLVCDHRANVPECGGTY